jgi:hypothetical protein
MPRAPVLTAAPAKAAASASDKQEDGYFLDDEVDRKAYVARWEGQYFDLLHKHETLAARLEDVAEKAEDMTRTQGRVTETVAALDRRMNEALASAAQTPSAPVDMLAFDARSYKLEVINVNPVKPYAADTVYLPPGSFVKATLLTGVYAPAEAANPLPVLIRLDEAFTGPNDARIPLEGAFAVGKAAGDLNSERALVQITAIASVLPGGTTFEHKGNIGYLTDVGGQLGLKGVVVRNTGGQLALSFMTGFMGGASQALADSQTTTVTTDAGHTARNVTGSRTKNAAFQGLAQSAGQMSQYYQDQLGRIVPAIRVDAGVAVYFIVLEGVQVHGLKKDRMPVVRFMD